MSELIGKRFGLLTVLRTYKSEKNYPVCECRCDCGSTTVVYRSNLLAGRTKSCGCLEEQSRKKYRDLRGKRFDRLTALTPTAQRTEGGNVIWECRCDCGSTAYVSGRNLVRGYTKSCGCLSREKHDITDQRFGKLVALYPDPESKKGRKKWICRCDCGEYSSVSISNLRNGHTKSCGCLGEIEYRTLIDGTCLEVIMSPTIPKNNRSGIKGVSYYSRTDSWVATLTFQGTHYYLGSFKDIQSAAKARQLAVDKIISPFLEQYADLVERRA